MRKLPTRLLTGGLVAVFAGATAFAATAAADASASGTTQTAAVTTTVPAKTSTALSIRERKAAITCGRREAISGDLTKTGGGAVGRRVVELYRYDTKTKKWVRVQVRLTGREGRTRFVVRPMATAEYELVYHGNAKLAASHSAAVTVTVSR